MRPGELTADESVAASSHSRIDPTYSGSLRGKRSAASGAYLAARSWSPSPWVRDWRKMARTPRCGPEATKLSRAKASRCPLSCNRQHRSMSSPARKDSSKPPTERKSLRRTAMFPDPPAGRAGKTPLYIGPSIWSRHGGVARKCGRFAGSRKPPTTIDATSSPRVIAVIHPGITRSSASQKSTLSVVAAAAPTFRAAEGPRRREASISRI